MPIETMQATEIEDVKQESREFPARAEVLIEIRRMIEGIAAHTRLTKEQVEDLLTAVDEAAANAIRHGSPKEGPKSLVRINCVSDSGFLRVGVRDFGKGFAVPDTPTMPGPEATGGRGLPLMVALASAVEIASSPQGTEVTLTKRASPLFSS